MEKREPSRDDRRASDQEKNLQRQVWIQQEEGMKTSLLRNYKSGAFKERQLEGFKSQEHTVVWVLFVCLVVFVLFVFFRLREI